MYFCKIWNAADAIRLPLWQMIQGSSTARLQNDPRRAVSGDGSYTQIAPSWWRLYVWPPWKICVAAACAYSHLPILTIATWQLDNAQNKDTAAPSVYSDESFRQSLLYLLHLMSIWNSTTWKLTSVTSMTLMAASCPVLTWRPCEDIKHKVECFIMVLLNC